MPPSSGELWGRHLMPSIQDVDFLMPNGLLISLQVSRSATLETIKFDLWSQAKMQPLFYVLKPPSAYVFVSVTQEARREEFHDETRRLCDLKLFIAVFKLVEPQGNREEEILNAKLNTALGIVVNDFKDSKDLEVVTFRRSVIEHCKKVVDTCEGQPDKVRAVYRHPPDIYSDTELPEHIRNAMAKDEGHIFITVWTNHSDENRQSTVIKVLHDKKPSDVVELVVRKFHSKKNLNIDSNSVLKICGRREYLLGNYRLDQYRHIRLSMARSCKPSLVLVPCAVLYANLPRIDVILPSYCKRGLKALQDINNRAATTTWSVNKSLRIKIHVATNVNVRDKGRLYIHTGIYHGTEPLCAHRDTNEVASSNPSWTEWLEYDLSLVNIPRCARLCLSLCAFNKKQTRKPYALAWGNINVFDFNARLVSEKISLQLWPVPAGVDDLLYPIGIPGSCPDSDAACIGVEFDHFSQSVIFPSIQVIEEYAKNSNPAKVEKLKEGEADQLKEIMAKDPLAEVSEQEKELLWNRRYDCQKGFPDVLPKLLQAVKWSSRDEVAELYYLLSQWPCIKPEAALELLYCTYTDLRVRQFAVKCLEEKLTDDKLAQYLLQLVQVLEFEPYLDNDLTLFLLKRSLMNRRIGHALFWNLRAEMHKSSVRRRFGLILEAYCRSSVDHVRSLCRQVLATDKLTTLSDLLKSESYDQQILKLGEHLRKSDYQEALQDFESPLYHGQILGSIVVESCDVKNSKKKPLFLTWKNQEQSVGEAPSDYQIIFKSGDDLRQDMLTLQVIGIMDAIWQSEGLDLRMIPYGCLAMGLNVGMIEVVRNATTVMQILKKDIKTNKMLHAWIKDNARGNPESYAEAVETFTLSCAGYCVATFVLGIGDRHPSNIMVTKSGQVFHIDFGHFLDHRKKKFGINRERVPFVLTEDFINVIAKGADQPLKSPEFNRFMELCGKAYISLRKHANVFITLFTLMLSCGIPELQSVDDIEYLRKTLKVDCRSEQEALQYFQSQFGDAYGGAWLTKLDWFFHYMKHRS